LPVRALEKATFPPVDERATAEDKVVAPTKMISSAEVVTSAPVETVPTAVPMLTVPPAVMSDVLLKETVLAAKVTVPLAPPTVVLRVAAPPSEKDPLEVTEKLPE
jgi:hypothetical protein